MVSVLGLILPRISRIYVSLGLILSIVVSISKGSCPSDLFTSTHACFNAFTLSYQRMQTSQQKLCCGLDVETLRALCRAYVDDMSCVDRLKSRCPVEKHRTIEEALVNLDGARAELGGLCSDDTIVENYAMHQSCFTVAGPGSEACLARYLDKKSRRKGAEQSNIRFLSLVTTNTMDAFCRKMDNTISCMERHVELVCGYQASALVAALVKPMVRYSATCDSSSGAGHPKHERPTRRPFFLDSEFDYNEHPPDRDGRSSSGYKSINPGSKGNNKNKIRGKGGNFDTEDTSTNKAQDKQRRNNCTIITLHHFFSLLIMGLMVYSWL